MNKQRLIDKQKIREALRRQRVQAFREDEDFGVEAAKRLVVMGQKVIESGGFSVVAGYVPMGSEIDPRPLMMGFAGAGARLCLPEVLRKSSPLQFREWQPGAMLVSGLLGTLQPMESAFVLEPDLLLVPLLGVDSLGVRLGQGGGFYDRTLEQLGQGVRAYGVAFDSQVVERLPVEGHDQLLDGVITPSCCISWTDERKLRYLAQA